MVGILPVDYFSESVHQVDDAGHGADFDSVSTSWVAVKGKLGKLRYRLMVGYTVLSLWIIAQPIMS